MAASLSCASISILPFTRRIASPLLVAADVDLDAVVELVAVLAFEVFEAELGFVLVVPPPPPQAASIDTDKPSAKIDLR